MKKRIALLLLIVMCVLSVCSCDIVKSPDYYELNDGDTVTSFTKVVGDRKVNTKKIEMSNAKQTIVYSYKEVEDAYADAEAYIDYLSKNEKFNYSGLLNLDDESDKITLTKTSPKNKEYVIRAIIEYDVGPKTVKITIERERDY